MMLPTLCGDNNYTKVNNNDPQEIKRETYAKMPYGQTNFFTDYSTKEKPEVNQPFIIYWLHLIRKYFSRNAVDVDLKNTSLESLQQEQRKNLLLSNAILEYDLVVMERYRRLAEKYENLENQAELRKTNKNLVDGIKLKRQSDHGVTLKDTEKTEVFKEPINSPIQNAKSSSTTQNISNDYSNSEFNEFDTFNNDNHSTNLFDETKVEKSDKKRVKTNTENPFIDNKRFKDSDYILRLPQLEQSVEIKAIETIPNYENSQIIRRRKNHTFNLSDDIHLKSYIKRENTILNSPPPRSRVPKTPIQTDLNNQSTNAYSPLHQEISSDSASDYYSPIPFESLPSNASYTSSGKTGTKYEGGSSKSGSLKSAKSTNSEKSGSKLVSLAAQAHNRRFLQNAQPPVRSKKREMSISTLDIVNRKDDDFISASSINLKDLKDYMDSPKTLSSITSSTKQATESRISRIGPIMPKNKTTDQSIPKLELINVVNSVYDFDSDQNSTSNTPDVPLPQSTIIPSITSPKHVPPRRRKYKKESFETGRLTTEDMSTTEGESFITDDDTASFTNHTRVSSKDEEVVMFFDLEDKKRPGHIYQKFTRKSSLGFHNRTPSSGMASLKGMIRRSHLETKYGNSQGGSSDVSEQKFTKL